MLTEANGIPIAIVVEGANFHDITLAPATLDDLQIERPTPTEKSPQGLCLDKAYDSNAFRQIVQDQGYTGHIKKRNEEAKEIKLQEGFRARRWVVERTHSWLNRFRGLLIRWSKKESNYTAFLDLVCGVIAWRSTGLMR